MPPTSSTSSPAATTARRRGGGFNLADTAIGSLHYIAGAIATTPCVIAAVVAYHLLRRRPRVAFVLACVGAAWLLHRRRQRFLAERATAA